MIKADKIKCIKCYKCLKVCPFNVLEKKQDGVPGKIESKICIECFHCAATCPTDAFTFNDLSAITDEKAIALPENFADDLRNHVMTRRSYRHFKSRPVEEKIIRDVLNNVRWAPSAKNQHPTKWIVVNSKQAIDGIVNIIIENARETGFPPEIIYEYDEGNNIITGEAHSLLIAYAPDDAINAPGDTFIAMTTAELLLQSQGIGTCWCGYLTRSLRSIPKLKEYLPSIPDGCSFYAAFTMGYPEDEEYIHIPARIKPVDVFWIE